jgi:hypothetical protein
VKNRKLSQLASTIATGAAAATQVRIPDDLVLYLQAYGRLGKVGYTTLRLALLPYGVVFPTYDETARHRSENVVPNKLV